MNIAVDTHVHSINSVHAYNTLSDITLEAQRKGLEGVVITDHFGPNFVNSTLFQSFAGISNLRNIPSKINEISVLNGVEIDIVDKSGNLAFNDTFFPFNDKLSVAEMLFKKCSLIIASYHPFSPTGLTNKENTDMLIAALENQHVHVLGHCDRTPGNFNEKLIIETAKELNKAIELNCHSLIKGNGTRYEMVRKIALLCAQTKTKVTIGSDAHFPSEIGDFTRMKQLLESINFPEELIVNSSLEKLKDFLES